jgi:thermostable 8-oxoguanine DNA glycosylase
MELELLQKDIQQLIKSPYTEFRHTIIDAVDSIAYGAIKLLKTTANIPNQIFWNKLEKVLLGICEIDETKRFSFIDKFEKRYKSLPRDFIYRLLEIVDKLDTVSKAELISNLTKSLIFEQIQFSDYYRILHSVNNAFWEDLLYLRDNIKKSELNASVSTVGLFQVGLMFQSVLNGGTFDEDGDNLDKYKFTELAYLLARFGFNLYVETGDIIRKIEVIANARWG